MRIALVIVTLVASTAAQADDIRFITCPIYRDADAGKKSGCWLADDPANGVRYDVSPSASKPDWNFATLVEGQIAKDQSDICGGTVLYPVRTSVLDTPCPRHMLLAEGYPGRKFVLPKRNIDPASVVRPIPPGPYANRTFRLFFDWNKDFIAYQREDWSEDQIITWIRAADAKRIVITGYAATAPSMVSGQVIAEDATIAQARAQTVAEALFRLGIPKDKIAVSWAGNSGTVQDAWVDGLSEPSRRRVDISVEVK